MPVGAYAFDVQTGPREVSLGAFLALASLEYHPTDDFAVEVCLQQRIRLDC